MNLLAKSISVIFHPLLIATYLFLLFGWLYPPALFPIQERSLKGIIALIFFTTCILPGANIYFFKTFGTISSVNMPTRKERVMPFMIITLVYAVVTYMIYARTGIDWQDNFMKYLLIIDGLVLCSFLFTLFLKISIHSLAINSLVGILILMHNSVDNGIFLYPMLVSILLAGAVMWSRLYLQVHTLREVITGAGIGLTIGMGGMFFLF